MKQIRKGKEEERERDGKRLHVPAIDWIAIANRCPTGPLLIVHEETSMPLCTNKQKLTCPNNLLANTKHVISYIAYLISNH